MQISYGWVIVGAGMVVTCVGFGAMFSLAVFLQPMSDTMGWSSTGISTAALLNFLCMGVGSFAWGALSDRLGTRAVVLLGGVLLGFGTVMASQAHSLGQFQVYFGVVVGFAAGSLYVPMTATTARWFTRHRSLAVALVSAGLGLGSTTTAPLARWIISSYDWRTAMLVIGDLAWLFIIPAALLVREPLEPAAGSLSEVTSGVDGRELTAAQALCTTRSIAMSGSSSARAGSGSGAWPSPARSARPARFRPRWRLRAWPIEWGHMDPQGFHRISNGLAIRGCYPRIGQAPRVDQGGHQWERKAKHSQRSSRRRSRRPGP